MGRPPAIPTQSLSQDELNDMWAASGIGDGLTKTEQAAVIGTSTPTIDRWRNQGVGIPIWIETVLILWAKSSPQTKAAFKRLRLAS